MNEDAVELSRQTKEELKQIAAGLGIEKIYTLRKDELVERICQAREQKQREEEAAERRRVPRERPTNTFEVTGILDVMQDGFGFLRVENYCPSSNDVYVAPSQIRRFNLKTGDEVFGDARPKAGDERYCPLVHIKRVNGGDPEETGKRRPFERLTPIYPEEKLHLDTGDRKNKASRLIDIITPIGKGQRGMIVAPPKAGKTTIIKQVAQSIRTNHPDVKLIVLLIDERPEEVTDMSRSIDGEVISSTFDQPPQNHCRVAEIVLERAKRLVESKQDVVILLDSITRLVRAYNLTVLPTGRTLSGGLDPDALITPKKFFGAARNIEEGGSLTIIATALVETGSRMDDVIFEEFKGTGNMELKLDRNMQERRIFPAIDILRSGTRREEELLSRRELEASWIMRRETKQGLESTVYMLRLIGATQSNKEFVDSLIAKFSKNKA